MMKPLAPHTRLKDHSHFEDIAEDGERRFSKLATYVVTAQHETGEKWPGKETNVDFWVAISNGWNSYSLGVTTEGDYVLFTPFKLLSNFNIERVRRGLVEYGEVERGVVLTRKARCRCCGEDMPKGTTVIRFGWDFHGAGSHTATTAVMHETCQPKPNN